MRSSQDEKIFVTKSILPPLEEYVSYVADIFNSHNLTNNGKYLLELEKRLKDYLETRTFLCCTNGTLALQLAIRHFGLNGKKVITTPFTYVATTSALLWENCTPVFADIDPDTLCLDPHNVEKQIDQHPDIAGIMPVHVFGNCAALESMERISKEYNIPVIYDAAHAFGCRYNGKSIYNYGAASICSFHSTKLFHTVEGGGIATPNENDQGSLQLLRAFGHVNDHHIRLGINAKMSELHAAMGLCLLPHIGEIIQARAEVTKLYDELLDINNSDHYRTISFADGLEWNHAYYPVIFNSEKALNNVMKRLAEINIFPRRYFYPSLTELPYIDAQKCEIAESIASRIICLPLYPDLPPEVVEAISSSIKEYSGN